MDGLVSTLKLRLEFSTNKLEMISNFSKCPKNKWEIKHKVIKLIELNKNKTKVHYSFFALCCLEQEMYLSVIIRLRGFTLTSKLYPLIPQR